MSPPLLKMLEARIHNLECWRKDQWFRTNAHEKRILTLEKCLGIPLPLLATVETSRPARTGETLTADLARDAPFFSAEDLAPPPGMLPQPAPARVPPEEIINSEFITAARASATPEQPEGSRYGSGAFSGYADPGPIHGTSGDTIEAPDCSLPEQEYWSNCCTPRTPRSRSPAPMVDDEPIWGRLYLGFQKRVADLEKQHAGIQGIVDTLGTLIGEIKSDDRIQNLDDQMKMVINYTSNSKSASRLTRSTSTPHSRKPALHSTPPSKLKS